VSTCFSLGDLDRLLRYHNPSNFPTLVERKHANVVVMMSPMFLFFLLVIRF
jgi:hypothetical protein